METSTYPPMPKRPSHVPEAKTVVLVVVGTVLGLLGNALSPEVRTTLGKINIPWLLFVMGVGLGLVGIVRWAVKVLILDEIQILKQQGIQLRQDLNGLMAQYPIIVNKLEALRKAVDRE